MRIVRVAGLGADGCHDPAIPGVLFIDIDSVQPELFIFGHELYHELRQVASYNPVIGSELKALAQAAKAAGVDMGNNAATGSEALADLLGSALVKPAFWQALNKQNPGLYARVVDFFKKLIGRLKLQVAGGRDVFAGVKDPGDMADRLAKLVNLWKNQAGSIANRRLDGQVNFSGDIPVIDISQNKDKFSTLKKFLKLDSKFLRESVRKWARSNIFGDYVIASTGESVSIANEGFKHGTSSQNQHKIALAIYLPEMLRNAVKVGIEPDRDGRADIVAFHYYHSRIKFGNSLHTIEIAVREHADGKRYYDHYLALPEKKGESGLPGTASQTEKLRSQPVDSPATDNISSEKPAVKPDDKISFSGDKSDNADKIIKAGINYKPGLTWQEKFTDKYYSFRKKFSDSNVLLKDIFGVDSAKLNPTDNPYKLAVAFAMKSGARAMQAIFHQTRSLFGNKVTGECLADILKPLVENGRLDEFGRYLVARRAVTLTKRQIQSGFDYDAAQTVIESAPESWQALADRVTAWSNRMLDLLVEGGAITDAEAAVIKKTNPIYVPFYRLNRGGGIKPAKSAGKGVTNYASPVKKIQGGDQVIIDPIESLTIMAEVYISRAQKAAIARAVANLAIQGDNGMAGLCERLENKPRFDRTERANQAAARLKKDSFAGLNTSGDSEAFLDLFEVVSRESGGNGRYTISTIVNGKRQWFYYRNMFLILW